MKMKKIISGTFPALLVVLLSVTSVFGATEIFNEEGVAPDRESFGTSPGEHIDPVSGGLTLTYTDLRLPGNGGLDLVINRTYNSKRVSQGFLSIPAQYGSLLGYGWDIHFGKCRLSGDVINIELQDGTRLTAKRKNSASQEFLTTNFEKVIYDPLVSPASFLLQMTDGTEITFDFMAQEDLKTVWYATKISKNGNDIVINYDPLKQTITSVVDTLGRIVNFNVVANSAGSGGAFRLQSITYDTYQINYEYIIVNPLGVSNPPNILWKVKYPVGAGWTYSYYEDQNVSPLHELKTVTTPFGGITTYEYITVMEGLTVPSSSYAYRAIATKTVGGRDVKPATWTFSYNLSATIDNIVYDATTIMDSNNLQTLYIFNGVNATYQNNDPLLGCWKYGLIVVKQLYDTVAASLIRSTSYDYVRAPVNVSFVNQPGPAGVCYDTATYPYLLDLTTVRGDDAPGNYTHYADFDTYGNPQLVTEYDFNTAQSGWGFTRTTNLTYWQGGLATNIIRAPLSKTVTGGPANPGTYTINYTYNSYGQILTEDYSGVVTTYSYDPNTANVEWAEDANLHKTYFTWANGRLSKTTKPIDATTSYTVERHINPDGTVAWEKNGRGYTTSYSYDDNMRLSLITPPAGSNPTTIMCDDAPNLVTTKKTVTRGGNATVFYYDGFGRDRGSVDSLGITSTVEYKFNGMKNAELSSVGDGVYYRYNGKIDWIEHQDGSQITYDYFSSSVKITDEKNDVNSVTEQLYATFGDPDDKLLIQIQDKEKNITKYEYNVFGSLTSVKQLDELNNIAAARFYAYDARNFLITETNPETGKIGGTSPLSDVSIIYGRDNIGNMTSRTDPHTAAVGGIVYQYDYSNRLKDIIKADGNLAYVYDNADNLTDVYVGPVANPLTHLHQIFDPNNRITSSTMNTDGKMFTFGYGYTGNDIINSIVYPTGLQVAYTINSLDQVTAINGFAGAVTNISYYISGVNNGKIKEYTYSNGAKNVFTYTNRNQVDTLHAGINVNSDDILNMQYGYSSDFRANLASIHDLNKNKLKEFGYDSLNRLTTFSGPWGSGAYQYDEIGNRTAKTVGSKTEIYSYSNILYPTQNNLVQITNGGSIAKSFTYNSAGDLKHIADNLQGSTFDLGYDLEHRLISFTKNGGIIANYAYDGNGRRYKKTDISNGVTTYYQYGIDGNVLSESDSDGNATDYIFLLDKMVAKKVKRTTADY